MRNSILTETSTDKEKLQQTSLPPQPTPPSYKEQQNKEYK